MGKNSKKHTSAKKLVTAAKRAVVKTVTEVRNTSIPKLVTAGKPPVITRDQVARRAYEIYASGAGGSEGENWLRAERELRGI